MPTDSGPTFACPICDETHDHPTECPHIRASDEDENEEDLDAEEIRRESVDEMSQAHVGITLYITFPREDNDIEHVTPSQSSWFLMNEMSLTEKLASVKLIEDGIERMDERFGSVGDDDDTQVEAMGIEIPANIDLGQLLGGGEDSDMAASDDRTYH